MRLSAKVALVPDDTAAHTTQTAHELAAAGIGPGLLRCSIGLEDVEDIIADLDEAMGS